MDDETKNLFDVLFSGATFLTVLATGAWAYFRFRREGAHKPRIEMDLECVFLGPRDGKYVAAFSVHAHNKGQIEHRFTDIRLRVRGICADEALATWERHEPRLSFPHKLFTKAALMPPNYGYFFVPPGVEQHISYVTTIPADMSFILARVSFHYEHNADIHTAERVFEVRPQFRFAEPMSTEAA
jgi:hypothetical protein